MTQASRRQFITHAVAGAAAVALPAGALHAQSRPVLKAATRRAACARCWRRRAGWRA